MDEGLAPLSLTHGDSGQWTLQPGWQVTLDTPYYPHTNGQGCTLRLHGVGALPGHDARRRVSLLVSSILSTRLCPGCHDAGWEEF